MALTTCSNEQYMSGAILLGFGYRCVMQRGQEAGSYLVGGRLNCFVLDFLSFIKVFNNSNPSAPRVTHARVARVTSSYLNLNKKRPV